MSAPAGNLGEGSGRKRQPNQFSTASEAQRRRIFELRAQGYDIPTVGRVTIHDDRGYPHRGVALYELLTEPLDTPGDAGTTRDLFGGEGSV